ncbi:MAG TPA: hypothetical protein PKB15_05280 [Acidimicrobiia bacterium]|nr:hypothetical protein [Acidimicrobiia bacterium]
MRANGKSVTHSEAAFSAACQAAASVLKGNHDSFVFSSDQFAGSDFVRALIGLGLSPNGVRSLLEQSVLIDNRLVTKAEIFKGIKEFLTEDCGSNMSRIRAEAAQDAILEIFSYVPDDQVVNLSLLALIIQKIDELPAEIGNEVARDYMRGAGRVLDYDHDGVVSAGKKGFLAIHARMFITSLRPGDTQLFNRFFSHQELTNIFAFATPPKIDLLARLHAERAITTANPTFQYVFDPMSEELEGLTLEQRQKLAEEFVDRLADLLTEDPVLVVTTKPPHKELPKETIVKIFGSAIARNADFNQEIIKALRPVFSEASPARESVPAL